MEYLPVRRRQSGIGHTAVAGVSEITRRGGRRWVVSASSIRREERLLRRGLEDQNDRRRRNGGDGGRCWDARKKGIRRRGSFYRRTENPTRRDRREVFTASSCRREGRLDGLFAGVWSDRPEIRKNGGVAAFRVDSGLEVHREEENEAG